MLSYFIRYSIILNIHNYSKVDLLYSVFMVVGIEPEISSLYIPDRNMINLIT